MIWNLSYRFRGKEIPTSWTIPQIILAGIMGFIVQTEAGDNAIYVKIASGGLILILLSTIVSITLDPS
jgi:hypothetical protein